MSKLYFEGLADSGEDLFSYDGSGTPVDLTANFEGNAAGIVYGYDNELGFEADPGPTIASAGSDVFFAGSNGLETLFVYNQASGKVSELEPTNAWGSGIIPEDIIAFGSKVFFVGVNADGEDVLWKSNGTTVGTKEIANSPTDIGDMALKGSTLFFRDDGNLESYNTQTRAFNEVASSTGIDPQDMLSAYSSGSSFTANTSLFMAGNDVAGNQNIYMKKGSALEEFKSNVYAGGTNPEELTALATPGNSGVYFSGIDDGAGDRGLYFVNSGTGSGSTGASSHQAIEQVAATFGGSANGLDPYDLTVFDGELYFTGNDSYSNGRGLFAYDPATGSATELIDSNQLDLNDGYVSFWHSANAPTMGVSNGELFFGAANPNATGAASVNQLYEYSGPGSSAILLSVNGQQTIGGQPANLLSA